MGNTNRFPVERTSVKAFHNYLLLGLKAPHNMGWKDIYRKCRVAIYFF